MNLIITALFALPFIVLLDLLWLGVIMKDFYRAQIGHLMSGTIVWPAAILFYFIYAFGIAYFVVSPALAGQTLTKAVLVGALFGLICYAVYDLTNMATLKDWPVLVTILDMLWGAFITAIASGAAYLLAKHFIG